jgi:PKD repeat protein
LFIETLETRELLSTGLDAGQLAAAAVDKGGGFTATPLNDLGTGTYLGAEGGLYPGGSNQRPAAFLAAGESLSNHIVPLDQAGHPDPTNGRIVMISVGMSNATDIFNSGSSTGSFEPRANAEPDRNPQLVIVDGAQPSMTADVWADPNSVVWNNVNQRLASHGVTADQVQVAWVMEALKHPANLGDFPNYPQVLEADLAAIARNLQSHYPNIRIAYVSSINHTFTVNPAALQPEPFAYQSAFAFQQLIASQIQGTGDLNFDPKRGPVVAPWLSWGPYLWANGNTPRSDGFSWPITDVQADGIHPSANGDYAAATQLLAFFETDPTATPWFLRTTADGQAPSVTASASATSINSGQSVRFTASATDPNPDGRIIRYFWTFDDGDFAIQQNPSKIFYAPGTYQVHLTVEDNLGNTTLRTLTIVVAGPQHLINLSTQNNDRATAASTSLNPTNAVFLSSPTGAEQALKEKTQQYGYSHLGARAAERFFSEPESVAGWAVDDAWLRFLKPFRQISPR